MTPILIASNSSRKVLWHTADRPSPIICATVPQSPQDGGGWAIFSADTTLIPDPDTSKPPYRVPSMAEIRALPHNGFIVASMFSGCGGSSLGYRMAGYRVAYANEFVEEARNTYRANSDASTVLDDRDIRNVYPADVLDALGMKPGELDVLDGSPPCSSFSTAGKREAGWGKVKAYSDTAQRTDDLFFEYARMVDGIRPRVFVAENVSGLVKGTAKGYFLEILARLKSCGYRVACRVLDAKWLGVPQSRQRTIFVGVRDDLNLDPVHPRPLAYQYTVRDAIGDIGQIIVGAYGAYGKQGKPLSSERPLPTVVAGTYGGGPHSFYVEPESDISRFAIGREWGNLAPGEKSDKYLNLIRSHPDKPSPCVTQTGSTASAASVTHPTERRKFSIAELRRICGFPDDFALTGSYAQQWERLGRAVPPVMMSHIAAAIRDGVLCQVKR